MKEVASVIPMSIPISAFFPLGAISASDICDKL